jgi:DNA-binding NarL/FixJ family response regulator
LVRRSELLQLRGEWPAALEWAERAKEWFSRPVPKPAVGEAFYQVGEVQRLRGNFVESEEAYRQASQWYQTTGPGLAQLRLAQGRVEAAHAVIRRMAEEVQQPGPRARVLDAYVEIVLAAGDLAAARAAAIELASIAARYDIPFLRALSYRASGAVLVAEGNAREALEELRQSVAVWCELQAPYEASRVRLLMALAYRKLGDEENALLEFNEVRQAFQRLGATADVSRVEALLLKDTAKRTSPLTQREVQVLRLVASGMTNREIADKLFISEKTVARHLSNIFTKLDLSSRTAATAYAYDHKLV